jgi:hypothetical protein
MSHIPEPNTQGVVRRPTACQILPEDSMEATKVTWIWRFATLHQNNELAARNHVPLEHMSGDV